MMEDNQPSLEARRAVMAILNDKPTVVTIPGTRHKVKLSFLRDCTVDKITELLLEREAITERSQDAEELIRSVAKHPYLNLKMAVCYVLNDYWKIRLFFPLVWRWWAYVWRLNESQVGAILSEVKKKTNSYLTWYSMNLACCADMRVDIKTLATRSQSLLTPTWDDEPPS